MHRALLLLFLPLLISSALAQTQKDLDLTAPDGTKLRATFYSAAKPGPGVLLLHMCNTTRKSWEPVAKELSHSGINALTVDNRGFGESGDARYEGASPEALQKLQQKWPADFDAAWQFLASQPGVDKTLIAAGGGSCGVDNAVKLAERHPDIKALVLLAGSTDPEGINFLLDHRNIPLFTAAAADDQYMNMAPQLMKWFSELTGNPRNKSVGFANGRHGTEIFGPHPELVHQIVAFYVDTLVTSPVSGSVPSSARNTPEQKFWLLASKPGSAAEAVAMFHEARQRDPNAYLFPEFLMNLLGYTRLQAGDKEEAIQLFKLNTEAYPASANTQDSLSDGYLAAGQKDLALAAEEKCLSLLPADPSDPRFKAELRKHAEEKVAELRPNTKRE
jgi:dienelactone hydrolase